MSHAFFETSLFGLQNGLVPTPMGLFGLGLGFGCRSKPKPGRSACKPVCSLSQETGLRVFLAPTHYPINLSDPTVCIKCLLPGIVFFSLVLITDVTLHGRRQGQPEPTLSIQARNTGLSLFIHSSGNAISPVDTGSFKTNVYSHLAPMFSVP
jgi:hypothetical protein